MVDFNSMIFILYIRRFNSPILFCRREREAPSVSRKRFAKPDEDDGSHEWGQPQPDAAPEPPADKDKVNFGLSGKLTEDTNTVNRQPKRRWR